MEPAIDRLLDIYSAAMAAPPAPGDASRSAAMHCSRIARPLKEAHSLADRLHAATRDLEALRADLDAHVRASGEQAAAAAVLQTRVSELQVRQAESTRLEQQLRARDRELASARAAVRALESEVAAYRSLSTIRLRDAMLSAPVVGPVLQAGARGLAKLLRH